MSWSQFRLFALGFLFTLPFVTSGYLRHWPYSDLILYGAAIAAIWRAGIRPPWWLLVFAGAVALQATWSADPIVTAGAAARIFSLGIVVLWALSVWDTNLFTYGVLWGLGVQAYLALTHDYVGGSRSQGLARHATIFSNAGYMAFVLETSRPALGLAQWIVAPVIIAGSGSRAAIGAVLVLAATSRRKILLAALVFVVFAGVLELRNQGDRLFDPASVVADIKTRILTNTGISNSTPPGEPLTSSSPSEDSTRSSADALCDIARDVYGPEYECGSGRLSIGGVGVHSYLAANPWPRPHSIYGILLYEWGILSIVPVGLAGLYAWRVRRGIPALIAIAALGLFDDTPFSQAEGHYLVAAMLLVATGGTASVAPAISEWFSGVRSKSPISRKTPV